MKTLIIAAICLIAGFVAGVLVPIGEEPEQVETEALKDASIAAKSQQRDDSDKGHSDSEPETVEAKESPAVVANAEESRKTLVVSSAFIQELSRKAGARTVGQALFERDGVIEEALQISNQEKAVVQTAWQDTQKGIRELEARASVSKELEDYSVQISVPDLSQEMKRLETSFSASVQQALGENRGDVFLAAKQVDQMIANSGGARTYTVAAEPVGEDGWRFRMTQEGADGRRVWVGDSIPEEIRHLTDIARISPRIDALPE